MKPLTFLLSLLILSASTEATAQDSAAKTVRNSYYFYGYKGCTFMTTGKHPYFILQPGYKLILKGKEKKDSIVLVIAVLDETKLVGGIETRVVEERETINGTTSEISRNYFAICRETGTIFYFGEDVDNYKNGRIVSHTGSWLAKGKNAAGVMLPGTIKTGDRYYEEFAPGVATDRAEILSTGETVDLPAGKFTGCIKIKESSEQKPHEKEVKWYAPGIGLIKGEDLVLVRYGYLK